jgi:hypothetical protein
VSTGVVGPGTILQDTYEIVRLIGSGAMGEVYEARHARLAGRYAVKLLLAEIAAHPDAFVRFRQEAEITSSLRHPSIVQVIDFNHTPQGRPYLVMEYLDGVSLDSRVPPGYHGMGFPGQPGPAGHLAGAPIRDRSGRRCPDCGGSGPRHEDLSCLTGPAVCAACGAAHHRRRGTARGLAAVRHSCRAC